RGYTRYAHRRDQHMFQFRAGVLPALAFTALSVCASAASICVNPAGTNGCKKTIGEAVAAASARDSIAVAAGTYRESVVIGKALTLTGDPGNTIIDATGLPIGIYVDGISTPDLRDVHISGFT